MIKSALKFGVVFAATSGICTVLLTATATCDFGIDPHGRLAAACYFVGMGVIAPSVWIGRALGIQEGVNGWLWVSLATALNALACLPAGMLIGALARLGNKWLGNSFRLPTVIGWGLLILLPPAALLWVVALCVFPASFLGVFYGAEFGDSAFWCLLLVFLSLILDGLIRYRPLRRENTAEPDAPPNSRSAGQLPTSPQVQSSDSQRTPSSGGCG